VLFTEKSKAVQRQEDSKWRSSTRGVLDDHRSLSKDLLSMVNLSAGAAATGRPFSVRCKDTV